MLSRVELEGLYRLNDGVRRPAIDDAQGGLRFRVPEDYKCFLEISNGLYSGDRLVLLELEELGQRNSDYEVQQCLPDYVMIGDDSGGTAILMKEGDSCIYEVGMGSMDEVTMQVSASSLEQLLIEYGGMLLSQRSS